MNITSAQIQGPREYQEDRLVSYHGSDGNYLFAVFDGHGGSLCANKAMELVGTLYEKHKNLPQIYEELDLATQDFSSGSTASIALIDPSFSYIHVGILGDSPVWLTQAESGHEWLSPEHNVRTNKAEADAVFNRGGYIRNGYAFDRFSYNGLQMSRALGDKSLDSILSREPEIFTFFLDKYSTVLLASDGLFDPSHDKHELPSDVRSVISYDEYTAENIVNMRSHDAQDNVSVIVVRAE